MKSALVSGSSIAIAAIALALAGAAPAAAKHKHEHQKPRTEKMSCNAKISCVRTLHDEGRVRRWTAYENTRAPRKAAAVMAAVEDGKAIE